MVSGESEIVVALRLPPPHAGAALEELGTRRTEEQERHLPTPVEEVLQEVQQGVVGPVQVLDDEHARPPRRHLLEKPPPRGERLLAARGDAVALRADERRKPGLQPCRLVHVRERLGHGLRELAARRGGVVRLEDSGFGLHDLAQCPERDALAVGEAAPVAPGDEIGTIVEHGTKLRGQATLPDPGLTDDGHQLHGRLALGAKERLEEKRPLVLAADERRLRRRLGLPDAASGLQRSPGPDRLGLPLRLDALVLPVRDRPLGRVHRRLVDDDATRPELPTGGARRCSRRHP